MCGAAARSRRGQAPRPPPPRRPLSPRAPRALVIVWDIRITSPNGRDIDRYRRRRLRMTPISVFPLSARPARSSSPYGRCAHDVAAGGCLSAPCGRVEDDGVVHAAAHAECADPGDLHRVRRLVVVPSPSWPVRSGPRPGGRHSTARLCRRPFPISTLPETPVTLTGRAVVRRAVAELAVVVVTPCPYHPARSAHAVVGTR